jgi:type I restriction-modification system DNA methylase subunit
MAVFIITILTKMVEAKIINQIDISILRKKYQEKDIEVSLVKIFLDNYGLKTKNKFLMNILKSENKIVTIELKKFVTYKKINLDLMTLEKIFELMQERENKKKTGTFYTPYFIANFIVNNTIKEVGNVLDPSCGCGSFLISALKRLKELNGKNILYLIEHKIYGIDISEQSIRRAKIILTLFALMEGEDKDSINFNLVTKNSLEVEWNSDFQEIVKRGGFDYVIGNPPYASIPRDYDLTKINRRIFDGEDISSSSNLYLFFIQLMTNLSKKGSGFIVPLSVSFNKTTAFNFVRNKIEEKGGEWYFSFYDRSPDSLFGDNIKTRNCIIIFQKGGEGKSIIYTTKLMRWNSQKRDKLFGNIEYLKLGRFPINGGIPKISKIIEFDVLNKLSSNLKKLGDSIEINSNFLENKENCNICLYFYSTAYNWISIFQEPPKGIDSKGNRFIPSSVSQIKCKDDNDQLLIYSILNSKLIYWWWMVWGDGFHVTKNFIENIPLAIDELSDSSRNKLVMFAKELSSQIQKYPIKKVNKGKIIENYNILKCNEIIDKIDKLLLSELSLKKGFLVFLKNRYFELISAGRDKFKNKDVFN